MPPLLPYLLALVVGGDVGPDCRRSGRTSRMSLRMTSHLPREMGIDAGGPRWGHAGPPGAASSLPREGRSRCNLFKELALVKGFLSRIRAA